MVRENGPAQLLPLVDPGGPHSHGRRGPRAARSLPATWRYAICLLVFAALPAACGRRRLRLAGAANCISKKEKGWRCRQPSLRSFLAEVQMPNLNELAVSAITAVATTIVESIVTAELASTMEFAPTKAIMFESFVRESSAAKTVTAPAALA